MKYLNTILLLFLIVVLNSCNNNLTLNDENEDKEQTEISIYAGTWNYTNNDYNQSDTFTFTDNTFEREDPGYNLSKGTINVDGDIMELNYTHLKQDENWIVLEYKVTYKFSVSDNKLSMIQDVNNNNIFGDTTSEPTIYYTKM